MSRGNKETGNVISCKVKIQRKLYPKDEQHQSGAWCVLTAKVVEVYEGKPREHSHFHTITLIGTFPNFNSTEEYKFLGKEMYNEKYDTFQYENLYFGQPIAMNKEGDQKTFLSHILTEKQLESLYEEHENPFEVIKREDVEELSKAHGIGKITALNIIEKYKNAIDLSPIYVQLSEYGLTKKAVEKLMNVYKSPQIVVDKIKSNPYILASEVEGIGWIKADNIALKSGIKKDAPARISSFICSYLEEEANCGNSYVDSGYLTQVICDTLEISDMKKLADVIQHLYKINKLWRDNKNGKSTKVGLMKYYNLEKKISKELKRINEGENKFKFDGWKRTIKGVEKGQGWEYTDEQLKAIELALKNQVIMITGGAGTGKSSVVNGIVKVLSVYDYKQCALSGKAASRMTEITGETGYTIHRLLGYKPEGFVYNEKNKLPSEIIIVDEISMVGGYLFNDLIKAVKTGAKLIVLGDVHQLESIGCMNIAKDMLESKYITSIELTQIHRQAQKSGIPTESMKVKDKQSLFEKGWIGHDIRGMLQDFELDVYNSRSISMDKCLSYFKKYLPMASDITEIQLLAPVKDRGEASVFNLNNKVQEIYNPHKQDKKEVWIPLGKDKKFAIRESDKIMVMQNDYKTTNTSGILTPIFNGQQGIVEEIDLEYGYVYVKMPYVSDELIVIPRRIWSNLSLGYATTIAKSQGSQFEYLIGCIDYSTPPMMLTKELVYTLMTRASKHCVLLGETKALHKAMTTSFISTKKTFLKSILDGGSKEDEEINKNAY